MYVPLPGSVNKKILVNKQIWISCLLTESRYFYILKNVCLNSRSVPFFQEPWNATAAGCNNLSKRRCTATFGVRSVSWWVHLLHTLDLLLSSDIVIESLLGYPLPLPLTSTTSSTTQGLPLYSKKWHNCTIAQWIIFQVFSCRPVIWLKNYILINVFYNAFLNLFNAVNL